MNASEIRDLAAGLDYVIRHTNNNELLEDALRTLYMLKRNINSRELTSILDDYIDQAESKMRIESSDSETVVKRFRPSDAAEVLENDFCFLYIFLGYFILLSLVSIYLLAMGGTTH